MSRAQWSQRSRRASRPLNGYKITKHENSGTTILALTLGLMFLFSHSGLSPVGARELQPKGASIGSASDKELGKSAETAAPNILPLKYSGPSSKPTTVLRFACDPRSVGISQYEGGTVAYCKKRIWKFLTPTQP